MICDIRWVCSFMVYFLRDKLITEESFTCIRLSTSNIFWFSVVLKRHSMRLSYYLYNNHVFMHHCIIVATQVVTGQMVLNVTLYMQLTSLQNWSVCLIYRISVLELYPYYPGSYIPGNGYWQNNQLCFSWNINKPLECCDRSMVFDANFLWLHLPCRKKTTRYNLDTWAPLCCHSFSYTMYLKWTISSCLHLWNEGVTSWNLLNQTGRGVARYAVVTG